MSKTKVDVLAVMDAEISAAMDACKSVHGSARLTALVEARAAVAELVEAAKEAELVLAEKLRRLGADPNVSPATHRLRAALAAIEVQP